MSSPVRVLGFNERGVPEPPADVVARLRAIDPQLRLKCYRWNAVDQWAIVWEWNEHDKRRARVRSGEIDPSTAVDILAYVPLEVTPDQIPGYVENTIKSLSAQGSYDYADALLAKVKAANAANKDAVWKPTLERAGEAIEANAGRLFADTLGTIPKVYATNPTTARDRRKGKR